MAKNKKKKKKNGLTFALWVLAFLIVAIVALAKKDEMLTNIKNVQVFERLFHKTPEFVKNYQPKETVSPKKTDEVKISVEPITLPPVKQSEPEKKVTEKDEAPKTVETIKKDSEKTIIEQKSEPKVEQKTEPKKEIAAPEPKSEPKPEKKIEPVVPTFTATLYFVEIDSDGRVNLKPVQRNLKKTDSPLSDVLNNLLSGPNYSEKTKNAITLIPEGTRLLGARVSNGIAYLDFSDEFQINTVGVEGYLAQLKQIVYTATTFSTVNAVQFLIEGQKIEYLGGEGVQIGRPIGR